MKAASMSVIWVLLTGAIGWSVLSIIFNRERCLCLMEKIALSYPLGLGLVSVEMAVLSAFELKFSAFSILIWWLPIFLAALILDLRTPPPASCANVGNDGRRRLTFLEKFFLCGIIFEISYAFFRALIKPIEAYDAVAIYGVKAKIFYLAGMIPPDFFTNFKGFVPHIEYPLLLPLSEAYFYIFLGDLNDLLVKCIFPLYYVSILTVSYCMARRILCRRYSLLFTFLLASVPQFKEYATNGYADLPLAFYCSASLFYLFLWIKEKRASLLILSFILSVLSAWTKTEGLMLAGVNLAIVVIYSFTEGKTVFKTAIYYTVASVVLAVLYLYLKSVLRLKFHGDFAPLGIFDMMNPARYIKRVPMILYEYQRQFFGPKKWNIVWIVFIGGLFFGRKFLFKKELKALTLAIFLILIGYTAIYMMLPGDISWHLTMTGSRFFIHFLPIVMLWIAVLFKEMKLEI